MTSRMSGVAYARTAGLLFLLTFVIWGLAEGYPHSVLIVHDDATATASKIIAGKSLFRIGVAGALVGSLCGVALTFFFYLLMRPAGRDLALLALIFQIISMTGFAMIQVPYYAALPILSGGDYLKSFSPDQLNSLALLSVRTSGFIKVLFELHYGAGFMLLGYLMLRSRFLPILIGLSMMISGAGLMAKPFCSVLAMPQASTAVTFAFLGGALVVMTWLLIMGVDEAKWQESAAAMEGQGA